MLHHLGNQFIGLRILWTMQLIDPSLVWVLVQSLKDHHFDLLGKMWVFCDMPFIIFINRWILLWPNFLVFYHHLPLPLLRTKIVLQELTIGYSFILLFSIYLSRSSSNISNAGDCVRIPAQFHWQGDQADEQTRRDCLSTSESQNEIKKDIFQCFF